MYVCQHCLFPNHSLGMLQPTHLKVTHGMRSQTCHMRAQQADLRGLLESRSSRHCGPWRSVKSLKLVDENTQEIDAADESPTARTTIPEIAGKGISQGIGGVVHLQEHLRSHRESSRFRKLDLGGYGNFKRGWRSAPEGSLGEVRRTTFHEKMVPKSADPFGSARLV